MVFAPPAVHAGSLGHVLLNVYSDEYSLPQPPEVQYRVFKSLYCSESIILLDILYIYCFYYFPEWQVKSVITGRKY